MPTFTGKINDRQIILYVAVSIQATLSIPNPTHKVYLALFDTGAQVTVLSPKVVSELGLQPVQPAELMPASGVPIQTQGYKVRIDIPIGTEQVLPGGVVQPTMDYRGLDLDVAELPYQPKGYDLILGMDFISAFHVPLHGEMYILSS